MSVRYRSFSTWLAAVSPRIGTLRRKPPSAPLVTLSLTVVVMLGLLRYSRLQRSQ
jgi:hypothetical protein